MDRQDAPVLDRELCRLRAQVGLVEHDDLRSLVETGAVERELPVDRREALVGVALGGVDHVDEQSSPLEVREEVVPEADPLARALDQAGDVRDRELRAVGRLDRAEHGLQRRERVVGDLGRRVRDPPEERGLAGVRQPGERGVGDELEAQLEAPLRPREARLGEARRLTGRRREPRVAAPPAYRPARRPPASPGARGRRRARPPRRAPACRPARPARRSRRRLRGGARRGRGRRAPLRRRRDRAGTTGHGATRPRSARRRRRGRRRRRRDRPSARTSPAGSRARHRRRVPSGRRC